MYFLKTTRLFTIAALILLALPVTSLFAKPAVAADGLSAVYVNKATGNDGWTGSSPTWVSGTTGPKKTIGQGIGVVSSDNGTVYVAAGIYYEHSLDLSSTMNLVGDGALSTVIDGGPGNDGRVLAVSSAPFQRNYISGFTIRGGHFGGSVSGGGIYISPSHIVTIEDCIITNNHKGGGLDARPNVGGGICNDNGKVYMNRCTVSGNSATLMGGGIANLCDTPGTEFGKMWLTNCTISGNTVTGNGAVGGGLYNSALADVTLLNVTIAGNSATGENSAGGGFSNSSISSMYFKNCIVAGNTAGRPAYNNGYNGLGTGVHSQGYNLSSDNSCYFDQPSDQVNIDPLLGPLQNNGGPTSTHAFTAASPAFNHGTAEGAPATDQRSVTRPQAGAYDMGAFELQVKPVVISCSPPAGSQEQTLTVIINGNYFTGASAISFSGTGITIGTATVLNDTQILTAVIIAPDALTGPRDVSVTGPGGTGTGVGIFNVSAATPVPGSGNPGTSTITPDNSVIGTGSHGSGSMGPSFSQPQTVVNPSFIVQSASLSQPQSPDAPVTVNVAVSNTSAVSGFCRVSLYVNGQLEAERAVSVPPRGLSPVSFTITRTDPGTYNVCINNVLAGSFTVEAVRNNDLILYISIAMVAISLILCMVYIVRRRSSQIF